MLLLLQGHEVCSHPDLVAEMFRLRARVFANRLGWAVEVHNGQERDVFDDLNPLYVISLTDNNKVAGTFRLLPTTGPHMLSLVFGELVSTQITLRSPAIWESTRFCIDNKLAKDKGPNGLNQLTGELLASLLEIGLYAGLSHIVTVVDLRMERILRRAACPVERLSPPRLIGKVPTLAVLMECTENSVRKVRTMNHVRKTCINPSQVARFARAA